MKKNKKRKIKWFNIFVALTMLLAIAVLGHDLLVWAVLPLFNHHFIQLTYFGFFVDMACFFVIEVSMQYLKDEMEK